MKRVSRSDVKSLDDYEATRDAFRRAVMAKKDDRRIHVGGFLTFLFENHDTMLYQVQEMIRAERMAEEAAIQHELDTYNNLLGDKGELGCTLLVEIPDAEKRPELLARWKGLPETIYLLTQSGVRVPAQFDPMQVGEKRISSVQYLKFKLGDQAPRGLGCAHPDLTAETLLTVEQTAALCQDLIS
jgi:hypothetical protein